MECWVVIRLCGGILVVDFSSYCTHNIIVSRSAVNYVFTSRYLQESGAAACVYYTEAVLVVTLAHLVVVVDK